jgi:hypothetical protein
LGYNTHIHGNVTRKLPVIAILNKNVFSKNEGQEGKTSGIWRLIPMGEGRR